MIQALDVIPLMIYDGRANPKSSKEVVARLKALLSRKLGVAISTLMLADQRGWLAPIYVRSDKRDEKVGLAQMYIQGYELTPSNTLIDALIKCEIVAVLQDLAQVVFALRKPIDDRVDSFVATYNWAGDYVHNHLSESHSVLNYLMDYCPEVAYFLSASRDIGVEKTVRNLLTRDSTAQCWVDDVWGKQ